jgi:hypothetical protein
LFCRRRRPAAAAAAAPPPPLLLQRHDDHATHRLNTAFLVKTVKLSQKIIEYKNVFKILMNTLQHKK